MCPHKWVVGSTFEWEFELPMPTNSAYQPKAQRKVRKIGNSKSAATRTTRSKSPKAEPARTAKRKASKQPKKPRPTPEERNERKRARIAETQERRKMLGLCKDCPNQAIADQSRCPSCAEKNRQRRLQNKETRENTQSQQ
jgi:hypothetical protein